MTAMVEENKQDVEDEKEAEAVTSGRDFVDETKQVVALSEAGSGANNDLDQQSLFEDKIYNEKTVDDARHEGIAEEEEAKKNHVPSLATMPGAVNLPSILKSNLVTQAGRRVCRSLTPTRTKSSSSSSSAPTESTSTLTTISSSLGAYAAGSEASTTKSGERSITAATAATKQILTAAVLNPLKQGIKKPLSAMNEKRVSISKVMMSQLMMKNHRSVPDIHHQYLGDDDDDEDSDELYEFNSAMNSNIQRQQMRSKLVSNAAAAVIMEKDVSASDDVDDDDEEQQQYNGNDDTNSKTIYDDEALVIKRSSELDQSSSSIGLEQLSPDPIENSTKKKTNKTTQQDETKSDSRRCADVRRATTKSPRPLSSRHPSKLSNDNGQRSMPNIEYDPDNKAEKNSTPRRHLASVQRQSTRRGSATSMSPVRIRSSLTIDDLDKEDREKQLKIGEKLHPFKCSLQSQSSKTNQEHEYGGGAPRENARCRTPTRSHSSDALEDVLRRQYSLPSQPESHECKSLDSFMPPARRPEAGETRRGSGGAGSSKKLRRPESPGKRRSPPPSPSRRRSKSPTPAHRLSHGSSSELNYRTSSEEAMEKKGSQNFSTFDSKNNASSSDFTAPPELKSCQNDGKSIRRESDCAISSSLEQYGRVRGRITGVNREIPRAAISVLPPSPSRQKSPVRNDCRSMRPSSPDRKRSSEKKRNINRSAPERCTSMPSRQRPLTTKELYNGAENGKAGRPGSAEFRSSRSEVEASNAEQKDAKKNAESLKPAVKNSKSDKKSSSEKDTNAPSPQRCTSMPAQKRRSGELQVRPSATTEIELPALFKGLDIPVDSANPERAASKPTELERCAHCQELEVPAAPRRRVSISPIRRLSLTCSSYTINPLSVLRNADDQDCIKQNVTYTDDKKPANGKNNIRFAINDEPGQETVWVPSSPDGKSKTYLELNICMAAPGLLVEK